MEIEIFELKSENLTNVGNAMGSAYSYENWHKPFKKIEDAKDFAEKDYGKPLEWITEDYGFRTKDLSYVMYYIKKITVE